MKQNNDESQWTRLPNRQYARKLPDGSTQIVPRTQYDRARRDPAYEPKGTILPAGEAARPVQMGRGGRRAPAPAPETAAAAATPDRSPARFSADWTKIPGTRRQYARPLADGSTQIIVRGEYAKVLANPAYQPKIAATLPPGQPVEEVELGKGGRKKEAEQGAQLTSNGTESGWLYAEWELSTDEQYQVPRMSYYPPAQRWIDENLTDPATRVQAVARGKIKQKGYKVDSDRVGWANVLPLSFPQDTRASWGRAGSAPLSYFTKILTVRVIYKTPITT